MAAGASGEVTEVRMAAMVRAPRAQGKRGPALQDSLCRGWTQPSRRYLEAGGERVKPGPNEPCHCGSGRKYKRCHQPHDLLKRFVGTANERSVRPYPLSSRREVPPHIIRPDYAETGKPLAPRSRGMVKTPEQLERLRHACHAARQVLEIAKRAVRPGVTTDEIDAITHQAYIDLGGYPSTLNYHGFPKSLCTSVNEVICHGIPDLRPLEEGDIVNLDITIYLEGMHGDLSETVAVGTID